ncbi:MAG: putative baseplate assembly protein [Anaerolineae bacterium]|nr:putative baseplate assembly protein [Anaerolineae bacterium]
MPIRPPALDDRNFDSIVEELVARIPAHTPEWTNPRVGDPGRTIVELFAWMFDTLLYRANLIPERQRLAFLRLLGTQMRAAIPARGLVSIVIDDDKFAQAVQLDPLTPINKPVPFETRTEISVLPISAEAYYKRPLTTTERADRDMQLVIDGLQRVYRLNNRVRPYVTTPMFANGAPEPAGFDIVGQTVDKCLWLALFAPKKELVDTVRQTLGTTPTGATRLLNVGILPAIEVPALFEEIGPRAKIPHLWEMSRLGTNGQTEYTALDVYDDTSLGLTQRGVQRIGMPQPSLIFAPPNNVRVALNAGVGDQPPRLDNPDKADRLVGWLRLRPHPNVPLTSLRLSWVGVNVVEVDQRRTIGTNGGQVIGISSGGADQEFALPSGGVEPSTLVIQVEEGERGYQPWQRIDDLALGGRDSAFYQLDSEAGTVRFGDGMRGRVPEQDRRIRVAQARLGGGKAGNLPPNSLSDIAPRKPAAAKLKIVQTLPTEGGEDAETLEQAERRIPALFRHKERAVTTSDYEQLAADTPGVRLGRVEVLPKFRPYQRQFGVPGVVSVMALPFKDGFQAPNPRPDRPMLEAVHNYLDARRPVATELYVIGCEYIRLGVSVGITVLEGFDFGATHGVAQDEAEVVTTPPSRDSVLMAVREALRRFLWPLAPGGVDGSGWALGRSVRDRELEVVIARVPGVDAVARVNLFRWQNDRWQMLPRATPDAPVELTLQQWQLPELLSVVVVADANAPTDLRGVGNPFVDDNSVAIPVVPKVC